MKRSLLARLATRELTGRTARVTGIALAAAMTTTGALWSAGPLPAAHTSTVSAMQALADLETACPAHSVTDSTITLTGNCATTQTLTVPDGYTLDGGGHTITASDAVPYPNNFVGAVLENAGPTMHLRNLTVRGDFPVPPGRIPLFGVLFNDASGSIDNVTVEGITRHYTAQLGRAIWIEATNDAERQTVTVTRVKVPGFQKTGLGAAGNVTVNVSDSTFGPPDLSINTDQVPVEDRIGQNTVQYQFGAGGTFEHNTVIGASAMRPDAASTGLLLFGAAGVTISDNTLGGETDIGILITNQSTDTTIQRNDITRSPATQFLRSGAWGIGVLADPGTTGTIVVGNTFSGWNTDLGNLTQPLFITTRSLPDGTVSEPYSATLEATSPEPDAVFTWSVAAGSLPQGLTLSADGTISGTPASAGTSTFTAQVSDQVDVYARDVTITIHPAEVPVVPEVPEVPPPGPPATHRPHHPRRPHVRHVRHVRVRLVMPVTG